MTSNYADVYLTIFLGGGYKTIFGLYGISYKLQERIMWSFSNFQKIS